MHSNRRKKCKEANLNSKVSKNILAGLYTHYAEANGLVVGVMEAGSSGYVLQTNARIYVL
jgi:hypothetical protein